jgi:hypothetical protein
MYMEVIHLNAFVWGAAAIARQHPSKPANVFRCAMDIYTLTAEFQTLWHDGQSSILLRMRNDYDFFKSYAVEF